MIKQGIRDEDELGELPPLDGDSSEQPEGEADPADVLDGADEQASLDDQTGEDDPPDTSDLDLEHVEGGWLGEAGEADDLDLGGDGDVVDFDEDKSDVGDVGEAVLPAVPEAGRDLEDEGRLHDEDLGFGDEPERGGLDAGDEGPVDADEELREADLPALDADDEAELEDAALIDPGFASDEPLGLPWAAEPWARVGSPVPLARATVVACAERGALVVGRSDPGVAELVRVDLEGMCERRSAEGLAAADVRSLAVEKQLVAAVLQGGRVLVSGNAGESFAPMSGPLGEAVAAVDAVFASERLWVRTRAGGLLMHDARGGGGERAPVERCSLPGDAAALTCDTATGKRLATVLVVDDAARPTAVVHVAPGAINRREAVDMPEADPASLFAACAGYVAYAARKGGIVWVPSRGNGWKLFEWEGRITALGFVDDAGTLAVSMYSDADDTTTLVRLDAAGNASVAARIGAAQADPDSDGRVLAMAHDEARGVLWVAGGFGVAAFAIK